MTLDSSLVLVCALRVTTGPVSNCPSGSTSYNGRCYSVATTPVTYSDADTACKAKTNKAGLKGSLVTIQSRYYQFIVTSVVQGQVPNGGRQEYWIGLNDIKTEGMYVWQSGAPITYSNWDSHQPDDWRHTEDCAAWRSWSNKWNDLSCTSKKPYICEVPDGECQSGIA